MNENWLRHTPAARTTDLVITEAGDEILVYDNRTHHIHHLNAMSAEVWRLCDGTRTAAEITSLMEAGDLETVRLALAKLAGAGLLEGGVPSDLTVQSAARRRFLRKVAVAGAVAVPAIISVSAPAAADHVSGHEGPCSETTCLTNLDCCNGNCVAFFCR